jgi:hypothetical protein
MPWSSGQLAFSGSKLTILVANESQLIAVILAHSPSRGLSGNASNLSSALPLSESREDYQVYRKEEIENADLRKDKTGDRDFVAMDVDGMILLALLVGGDYHPVSRSAHLTKNATDPHRFRLGCLHAVSLSRSRKLVIVSDS